MFFFFRCKTEGEKLLFLFLPRISILSSSLKFSSSPTRFIFRLLIQFQRDGGTSLSLSLFLSLFGPTSFFFSTRFSFRGFLAFLQIRIPRRHLGIPLSRPMNSDTREKPKKEKYSTHPRSLFDNVPMDNEDQFYSLCFPQLTDNLVDEIIFFFLRNDDPNFRRGVQVLSQARVGTKPSAIELQYRLNLVRR